MGPGGDRADITARLAERCATFSYDSVPSYTRGWTKLILLDTFGVMLSVSRPIFPGVGKLTEFVRGEREGGPCSVVGTELRTSPVNAALMNGWLGYALDTESHHGPAVVHAAAVAVPAAMAVAQERGSSGSDFLAAVVLGIDVHVRAALTIGPNDLYARGFHPTSVAGAFGAAAAAGLLLGLDVRRMGNAFGLAASQACGLLAWASDHSEESRPFNPGLAARNGVTAASLAALDFGAPQDVLDRDAKYNVYRAWSLDGRGSPERLLDGFGERFAIDELNTKKHASCSFTHPAADGLLAIMAEEEVAAGDIARIVVRYPRSGAHMIDNNELRSHRIQYVLPVAAVRSRVEFEDIAFDRSSEPEIERLAGLVDFVHDDELDPLYPEQYTTVIEVVTGDGSTHARRVDWARGCPENPMTREEIEAKYRRLAGQRVDAERVEQIARLVDELDRAERLDDLAEALAVS
jgi:2-methylcitrate dehydratase PrpD